MFRMSDFKLDVHRDSDFSATGPYDGNGKSLISFAAGERYLNAALENPAVVAVIVPESLVGPALAREGVGVAVSEHPRETFFQLHNHLAQALTDSLPPPLVEEGAEVAHTARLAPGCVIRAGAQVMDMAFVGAGTVIEDGVFIGEAALVGVNGHFDQHLSGRRLRVEHVGRVRVCSGAQILAGAIVQRDVYDVETMIGADAVIGPGVRVAHGVTVGVNSVLAGGTIVAGYTEIGRDVWVGPGSTIGNNLEIGNSARIEIGSVVVSSVAEKQRVSGNFALPHTRNLRIWRENGASK
ncbi:hypothetical protein [Paracoccus jiaweipingae]|uniref:hypothetical protein n=1 Tax=unclassified Paracoccus (in: a-proteobacteria) TaxID=2688777 RepID=UPI0037A7B391